MEVECRAGLSFDIGRFQAIVFQRNSTSPFPIHETETSVSLAAIIYSSRVPHSGRENKKEKGKKKEERKNNTYQTAQMLSIQFVARRKKVEFPANSTAQN